MGIIGGIFTTLAGGGSMIVIPALIFLGFPPVVASAINRVGIMFTCFTAIFTFKNKGYYNLNLGLLLGIPAVIGSIIGAEIAVSLPEELFNQILILVMLFMLGLIFINTIIDQVDTTIFLSFKKLLFLSFIFFIIGIYGGFIQAGVGMIILVTLSILTGFSIVEINSIKVVIMVLYLIPSLIIYMHRIDINWIYTLSLFIGNYTGAYLGTVFSFMADTVLIKIIFSICIITLIFFII
ncbi:MAG: sulfite exporter TauE/SafE family protein [Halanaerobiales bacterium]